MKLSLFVIMMVLVNSAFAGECDNDVTVPFLKSLEKNGVATVCTIYLNGINNTLSCYDDSTTVKKGLKIDHMSFDGRNICVAVSKR